MTIEFDERIKQYFEDYGLMKASYGAEITKSVKKRMDVLIASESFSIFLSTGLGNPHLLTSNLKGLCAISVNGPNRLIVEPVSKDLSVESLKKCDCVIIRGVQNYHGEKSEWVIP